MTKAAAVRKRPAAAIKKPAASTSSQKEIKRPAASKATGMKRPSKNTKRGPHKGKDNGAASEGEASSYSFISERSVEIYHEDREERDHNSKFNTPVDRIRPNRSPAVIVGRRHGHSPQGSGSD